MLLVLTSKGGSNVLNQVNIKALIFAIVVCLIASVGLSVTADVLRPMQERNVELDRKKNILKALKLSEEGKKPTAEYYATVAGDKIESLYSNFVKSFVVTPQGDIIEGLKVADIKEGEESAKLAVYQHVMDGNVVSTAIPIIGQGLWSTLYGFIALESNLNTVKGLTFYAHGETPGLGAEISADWFQDNFVGKKILAADGSLKSIKVAKGKAKEANINHEVDGISGATLTANGVTNLLAKDLAIYNNYFSKVRGGK
jgi:Na+-transporting NADH:ubiquinone oxidoreductase subunit C